MTDLGAIERALGRLQSSDENKCAQMNRSEKTMNNLAKGQNEIRGWVLEDRGTVRGVKWVLSGVALLAVLLGIDRLLP